MENLGIWLHHLTTLLLIVLLIRLIIFYERSDRDHLGPLWLALILILIIIVAIIGSGAFILL